MPANYPEEKHEKLEKEEEKHEKDEKDEESWDEKIHRDPLAAAIWAGILIWAGLVFLASNLGWLDRVEGIDAWGLVFVGAGLLVLLQAALRTLLPEHKRPITGTLILGGILIVIGLGDMIGSGAVWALALIAVGLGLLLSSLRRSR